MKKYITNFASGFTLAELLISMLVSAIIAAALVPVIGIKKVKQHFVHFDHGIAECYYNKDGSLQAYSESNRKNKNIKYISAADDHCRFSVPNTQYMQIFVIGAGADSTGNAINYSDISIHANEVIAGDLIPNNNLELQLDDLNNKADMIDKDFGTKLKNALDKWSAELAGGDKEGVGLMIKYILKSPIGRAGSGTCKAVLLPNDVNDPQKDICDHNCKGSDFYKNAQCSGPVPRAVTEIGGEDSSYFKKIREAEISNRLNTERYCWAYVHGGGQNSGRAGQAEISLPINSKSLIDIVANYEKTEINITNKVGDSLTENTITLTKSEDGETPRYDEVAGEFVLTSDKEFADDAKCFGSLCTDDNFKILEDLTYWNGSVPPSGERAEGTGTFTTYTYANYAAKHGNEIRRYGHITSCEDIVSTPRIGEVDYEKIHYNYRPVRVSVKYPRKGDHGEMKSIMVEKLSGSLDLYPARTTDDKTFIRKNDDSKILISANSAKQNSDDEGTDHPRFLTDEYNVTTADMPYSKTIKNNTKPYNKEYFADYLSKLNNTKGGLANCEEANECPGFGAASAYFSIIKMFNPAPVGGPAPYDFNLTLWKWRDYRDLDNPDRNNPEKYYAYTLFDSDDVPANQRCEKGDVYHQFTFFFNASGKAIEAGYCAPEGSDENENSRRGQPGAVIIVW